MTNSLHFFYLCPKTVLENIENDLYLLCISIKRLFIRYMLKQTSHMKFMCTGEKSLRLVFLSLSAQNILLQQQCLGNARTK